MVFSHLRHCLFQVGNDIFDIFYANTQPNQVGSYAGFPELLVAELSVSMACRMQNAGTGIGHMRHDADEVQVVHEADCLFLRAFQSECYHAASSLRHVFLSQSIVLVRGQTCIVHPSHLGILLEPLGNLLRVLAMAGHAEVERLESEVEEEGVLRSGNASQVAHQLGYKFGGVSHLAESLRVGQAVIGLVGCAKAGELLCVLVPIEVAAIDHYASDLSGMTVHVLCGGVRDDVATPFEGTAIDGCGEGVVHDKGHTMLVSHLGETLYVEHITTGVRDGLAEETFCVGTETSLDTLVIPIGVNEGAFYAQFLQRHAKEVEGASVNRVGRDEMVASLTDVEDGIEVCGLSATGQHSSDSTFQSGNLLGDGVVRGVGQTGIEIAAVLEVEESGHLVARLVAVGCTLIDGELLGFAFPRLPSAVDADGFEVLFHDKTSFL